MSVAGAFIAAYFGAPVLIVIWLFAASAVEARRQEREQQQVQARDRELVRRIRAREAQRERTARWN